MTLTAEQKQARREARAAATERERARRAAARPAPTPKAPPPARIVIPADTTGWTEWCEEARHSICPRPLTCRCPCHDLPRTDAH